MARPRGTHSESVEEQEDSLVRGVKDRRGLAINRENAERNAQQENGWVHIQGKLNCVRHQGVNRRRENVCLRNWTGESERGGEGGWIAGKRRDESVCARRDGLVCLLLPVRGSVLNCWGQIKAWQQLEPGQALTGYLIDLAESERRAASRVQTRTAVHQCVRALSAHRGASLRLHHLR